LPTPKRRPPGSDSGTSRTRRRRGEGRSADGPSPSAHENPFLLMRVVRTAAMPSSSGQRALSVALGR
jgi:hypothetical protein